MGELSKNTHTILCVDDEPNILNSLKRLLRKENYKILLAKSAEEALSLLEKEPVQCIITDQRMPGMSGIEFLKRVRAKYPDIIRIVLSGYTDARLIAEAVNEGNVYKFIFKPWNDDQLRVIIKRSLEQYELLMENKNLYKVIKEQNEKLKNFNEILEQEIKERTKELALRNRVLKLYQDILELLSIPIFGIDEKDYYTKMLGRSFRHFNMILSDDGILVTYFAHSSPRAWIDLIKSGWEIGNFKVTRAWSLMTESAQRVTARGKTALESSIVVVWRKKEGSQAEFREIYQEALENAEKEFQEAVKNRLSKADIFLATMIGALSQFTRYDKIIDFGKEIDTERIVKEAYSIAVRVLSRSKEKLTSPESLFYLTVKSLFRTYSMKGGQATLEVKPIILSSQDVMDSHSD